MIYLLIYATGFFAARWINKRLNKLDSDFEPLPIIWFFSWVGFLAYLTPYLVESFAKSEIKWPDWLIGKGWK